MIKQFGTDGVRGEANVKLTPDLAFDIGRALTAMLKAEKKESGDDKAPVIFVGKDTRLSCDMLESALAAGICTQGGILKTLGVIPTPAVSALVREEKAAAGVVISASHNPFYDNGIKIFGGDGRKLADEKETAIEEMMAASNYPPLAQKEQIGKVVAYPDGGKAYIDRLKRFFPLTLSRLKVVVDTANGATSDYAPALFRDLGATVIDIFHEYNGVNINDGCGSTKPAAMAAKVTEVGADLGIAYDGDGDRLIMADHTGDIVDGDRIMGLIAAYLKKKGELDSNLLVVTVMSNLGLKLAMQKLDINISVTSVGDKNVMVEMDQRGAILGGEQSGHLILSQYNPTGDGILSSLMVLKIMAETKKSLRELASMVKPLPQILHNITVENCASWQQNTAIVKAVHCAENKLGARGRILIRPSGTEPLLRVMGEGNDEVELENILQEIITVINEELHD
jgi:phosphoglucosamine mutase